jgi:general secretion pathway protein I
MAAPVFPRAARGFTLLEILVAFVVLAAAAGVLYRTFSLGLTSVDMVGSYSDAIAVAEAKLGALGLEKPLIVGEDSGTTDDRRFEWRVAVQDYWPSDATEQPVGFISPVKLLKATVTVTWDQRGLSKRSIELSTLRNIGMNNP